MSESKSFQSQGAVRMGRSPLKIGLCILAMLAGLGFFALAIVARHDPKAAGPMVRIGLIALMLGGFALYWQLRMTRKPVGASGAVSVDEQGVSHGGQRLASRDELKSGVIALSSSIGTVVHLERKNGPPLDLRVRTLEDGRAMLRSLGFEASKSTAKFTIAGIERYDWRRRYFQLLLSIPLNIASVVGVAILTKHFLDHATAGLVMVGTVATAFLVHFTMLMRLFITGAATVGADGVHLRWRNDEKFIPMSEIVRAEPLEEDPVFTMLPIVVRLHLRDGSVHNALAGMGRVTYYRGAAFNDYLRTRANSFAERVNEILTERANGVEPLHVDVSALARASRPRAEWVEALRGLVKKTDTFREDSTAMAARLWEIVEDTGADAVRRAAAAVALSGRLDERGRERLSRAAEATASPKLRLALTAAANDQAEKELASALEEVEEEHARAEA